MRTPLALHQVSAIVLIVSHLASCGEASPASLHTPGSRSDRIIVEPTTRFCLSGQVTAIAGLDDAGVNWADDSLLAGELRGWVWSSLDERGLVKSAQDYNRRIGRFQDCGADDVHISGTLEPNLVGQPYHLQIVIRQGSVALSKDVWRPGLRTLPAGWDPLTTTRHPDESPYWNIWSDTRRTLNSFEPLIDWS